MADIIQNGDTRYLTVAQFVKIHPWPPLGGLRNLIFNEETNGFNKVIRRVGKRILINEKAFFEWLENQKG